MRSIWVHTLVRNEEKWVWYSVMSVINHVDRILLWDMESTDATFEICKEIKKRYPKKVDLKVVNKVDAEGFAKVRQQMLDATHSDWFMVVDGDEIWWDDSIRNVTEKIQKTGVSTESVVVPVYLVVGDIFHYQDSSAGRYRLAGKVGHLGLRAINRKIPGLSSDRPHGTWGWTDRTGQMIQDRDEKRICYVDAPYIHATHLQRAGTPLGDKNVMKRTQKLKHEVGIPFPGDFYFPEVFFRSRPEIVPSPWNRMDLNFYIRSLIETPLRRVKRKVSKWKVGY